MIEEKAKIFKALSDPNRLRILAMLKNKKLCVCEITHVLNLATSTVSQHLSILRQLGYIIEEKEGKWVNYLLNTNSSDPVIASIISQLPFWINNDDAIKKDTLLIDSVDRNKLCSI